MNPDDRVSWSGRQNDYRAFRGHFKIIAGIIVQVYFPMQKVEKIKFKISSGVVCPVSESSAHSAR